MTETPPSNHPLTDQALARLRKLAEGNGLAPDKIELIESVEKTYTFEGVLQLVPFCSQEGGRYAGAIRGQGRMMLPDSAALHEAARAYQQNFLNGRTWMPDVLKELKNTPANGWGLHGAKITLPAASKFFATSAVCPNCQGNKVFGCHQCNAQGFVVCAQCEGRGWELCYNCAGRGVNPAHPNQPCTICHGKRYAPCRFCHSTGKLVCPTCQGRRNTICPRCGGVGQFTEEVGLNCGVSLNFSIKGGPELPSGLRRGIDRLGPANLVKGYADIRTLPEDPEKEKEKVSDPQKTVHATIRYEATMPYADMKMRFGAGARAVLVSVFGKRASLMGVPAFLDESLKPWREKLKAAARGEAPLEKVLEARLMKDALRLEIGGEGKVNNIRRLYPVGLSANAAQEIFLNMRKALNRFTRSARIGAAIGGGAIGAAVLAGFMFAPLHAQLNPQPWLVGFLIDVLVLAGVTGLAWVGLGKMVQMLLKQRFPDYKIALHQNVGRIGAMMLGGIVAAWIIILVSMPEKPVWMMHLFGNF